MGEVIFEDVGLSVKRVSEGIDRGVCYQFTILDGTDFLVLSEVAIQDLARAIEKDRRKEVVAPRLAGPE